MDETIFKKYDIRGIYPDQINAQVVYNISRGFLDFVKEFYKINRPKIIVSRDIRLSSVELEDSINKGLIEGGAEVIDMGLCSTPLNYFANFYSGADASIVVTASHNSKEYNGLKLSLRDVVAPSEIGALVRIKDLVLAGRFSSGVQGTLSKVSYLDKYIDFIKKQIDFSNFKIAVNCVNGMIGPELKGLGIDYKGINLEPDGNFPNYEPNPLDQRAQQTLIDFMEKDNFDLGIIFDGDGDRLLVIDSNREIIRNDYIIGLLAKYAANGRLVCDARVSRGVTEEMQSVIRSAVGYPNIRRIMRKEDYFFGGELSGHFFWKDFSFAESPLLSTVRLLNVLEEQGLTLGQAINPFKKYFSPGEINFKGIENKIGKIKEVEKQYSDGEISHLDGLTVEYPDWWFNLRPSNTEPLLRLVVEANSQALLEKKISELKELI